MTEQQRQVKFHSAFKRIAFTHGIACHMLEVPSNGSWLFELRQGRMTEAGNLSTMAIRQIVVAVSILEIEQSVYEPGGLALLRFTDAVTKLWNLPDE